MIKTKTETKSSTEGIKSAASRSLQNGGNIHEKVRDLTLQAMTSRRFEPEQIKEAACWSAS